MSFKDIKGQEKAIELIRERLKQGQVTAGYLFTGPQGIGKNLAAKTLAKALNCLEENLDSCDKCASCLKIEKGQHPDVHIIGNLTETAGALSSAVKIEEVRQLQKEINLRPYEGRKKVFIIDNAHNLTAEASGALLKTLEEPPANSLIILVTSRPALLFKTIISRCQVFKFSPLPRMQLEKILRHDFGLDLYRAHYLAYFCEGRLGYALGLKDSNALKEKNTIIDELNSESRFTFADSSLETRQDMRAYLNILATWFRDAYLLKTGVPHGELINLDRKPELLKLLPQYSFRDLDNILNFISQALFYSENNINTKLLLSNLRCLLKG